MLSPTEALEQAHGTAREYAIYAKKAYEDLFGMKLDHDPKAAATFMAGFMQAASTDFAAWAIQNQLEGLRNTINHTSDTWLDRI